MNILVIDDQANIRSLLQEFLTGNGYTVYEAEQGKQAIDILVVYRIDCIITDILMEELDGIEFILRLRESKIPIISISGLSKQAILDEFVHSLGIIGMLQKPFEMSTLLELIRTVDKPSRGG